jgi:transposase
MGFIRKIKRGGKTYLAEVKNVRVKGKVVQRHIRYIGKEADGKTILSSSISNIQIDDVKIFGPLLVLNQIARSIKLDQLLGKYSQEILSMVYAHCVDYRSLNQMQSWYQRTDLNYLLNLDNLTESKLVSALDYLENLNPTELQKNIFLNVKEQYEINGGGIVYDVTNTYFYGKRCSLGKYGKDKEGRKGNLLIQIGLGVTKHEGVPVFHKVFDGNVHDARTFSDSITEFKKFGINDGLILFDRGVTSKKNHQEIAKLHWKVICGVPLDKKLKSILRDLKETKNFSEYRNRVKLNKTVFYVVSLRHSIGGIKGKLVFCFNEYLKKEIKESRYDEISNAQKLIDEGKSIKPDLKKFFGKDNRLLKSRLDEAEEFDGYSCIFTTAKISNSQLVKTYFDKDLVEKAFQSLKGVIKLRPIRHWLYNRVIAHVMICYLALLLLSLLKLKLIDLGMSPVSALRELETMYKVYGKDSKKGFTFSKIVALTKQQEKILKSIDKALLTQV